LPTDQAHHVRDVLRLAQGEQIEVFDASGRTGKATIVQAISGKVLVQIDSVEGPIATAFQWTIASAIPKSSRADWMIEKLSELGTSAFIPLLTDRSVVEPKGQVKIERWQRLAAESAKQSRRIGVMEIQAPTKIDDAVSDNGWYLSPAADALPIQSEISNLKSQITLFVGPEGGWSPRELELFQSKALTPIALTTTILRVETAAIAAAAVLGSLARTIETRTKGQSS
jgi:16S rRNA (uracil1498-N3)-methyltransferase